MVDNQDIDVIFAGLTSIAGGNGVGFVADKDKDAISLMREQERVSNTKIGTRLFASQFKTWDPVEFAKWQKIVSFAGEGACTVYDEERHFVPEHSGFVIYARWGVSYLKKTGE